MLLFKLTVAPLFIAVVTLAGRYWGASVAGLFSGFPVVAGPIVIFVALEQGPEFGSLTATAAISAIASVLAFGIAYSWVSLGRSWLTALLCAVGAWVAVALVVATLPSLPQVTLAVAAVALLATPWLLPPSRAATATRASLNDLPLRMLTGGLLTLAITGAAAALGEVWSGILAVFPVSGLVLTVFTHRAEGAPQVAEIFRGMVRGLYSFAAFFLVLAFLWPQMGFWSTCALACVVGLLVQVLLQWLVQAPKTLQPTR